VVAETTALLNPTIDRLVRGGSAPGDPINFLHAWDLVDKAPAYQTYA